MKKSGFKKRIIFLLMTAVLLTGCNGQKLQTNTKPAKVDKEEIVMLTERQKEILKEGGLSTEYEELSLGQKSAICAIEEMLCYLEEKYKISFVYLGYVPAGGMDKEHLLAFQEDMSSEDVVTVYRNIRDTAESFTDDYPNILAGPVYQERLEEYIQSYFLQGTFKLFIKDVNVCSENIEKENVLKNVEATICLIVNEETSDAEELKKFIEEYSLWIQKESEKSAASSLSAYVFSKSGFEQTNQYNYMEHLREYRIGDKIVCSVSNTGEINIY